MASSQSHHIEVFIDTDTVLQGVPIIALIMVPPTMSTVVRNTVCSKQLNHLPCRIR
jgi:hypothetical protein